MFAPSSAPLALLQFEPGPSGAEAVGFLIGFLVVYLLIALLMYLIGKKFGIGSFGEYCIPIYNAVLLCRCGGLSGWFVVGLMIPYVQIGFQFHLYGCIARRLGRNYVVFGLLGALLPLSLLILALDASRPVDERVSPTSPSQSPPRWADSGGSGARSAAAQPSSGVSMVGLTGQYKGAEFDIPREGLVVGRSAAAANIVFTVPEVSSRHARLQPDPNDRGLWVEDLGSRNGTFVCRGAGDGGKWLRVEQRELLDGGDRLRLVSESVAEFQIRLSKPQAGG